MTRFRHLRVFRPWPAWTRARLHDLPTEPLDHPDLKGLGLRDLADLPVPRGTRDGQTAKQL